MAKIKPYTRHADSALTLTELIVVLVVISLFILLVPMNLFGILTKSTFNVQAQELISTLQMAASAAAESDRRYEVILDITEQSYTLRQITTPDLSEVLEEEIIVKNDFSDKCRLFYVLFDDGDYTNKERAKFRAGHSGWQYGGKIVLLDSQGNEYSVVISRLSGIVTLERGDFELLTPQRGDELFF
jgi:Tfp pilus assembly protein FimT